MKRHTAFILGKATGSIAFSDLDEKRFRSLEEFAYQKPWLTRISSEFVQSLNSGHSTRDRKIERHCAPVSIPTMSWGNVWLNQRAVRWFSVVL